MRSTLVPTSIRPVDVNAFVSPPVALIVATPPPAVRRIAPSLAISAIEIAAMVAPFWKSINHPVDVVLDGTRALVLDGVRQKVIAVDLATGIRTDTGG